MTDEERVRALKAESLIGDETFNEAFATLEAELIEQWKGTAPSAVSVLEELWSRINALQSVRGQLQSWSAGLAYAVRQQERRR